MQKNIVNTNDAVIHARINSDLKSETEKIFSALNLSQSEAIRLFYQQVILHKGLPFLVKIPNEETIQAIHDVDNDIDTTTQTFEEFEAELKGMLDDNKEG
jgi:DNA-damage-inducible protein J